MLESFELLFGRRLFLFLAEHQAELIAGLRTIGFQFGGRPQLTDGVVRSAQLTKNLTQIAMRFVTRGVQLDGAFQRGDRLGDASRIFQSFCEHLLAFRILGIPAGIVLQVAERVLDRAEIHQRLG